MPHWRIKAAIQGTLSRLPDPQRWNRLFQQRVTRSLRLTDEIFIEKWSWCRRHTVNLAQHRDVTQQPYVALELGTGWYPVAAVCLAMSGGTDVYTVDVHHLLTRQQVTDTLRVCQRLAGTGQIEISTPDGPEKLETALAADANTTGTDLLAMLGVTTIVGDARELDLDSASIDLICSDSTLEHIPRPAIADIFREFHRLLAPEGLMSHHIDLADHYVTFDPGITVYNFLQFSERQWARYNSALHYQNRLRINDYHDIHTETGWRIIEERNTRKPVDQLRSLQIAEGFRPIDEEDLAVHSTWLQSVHGDRPNRDVAG